MHMIDWGIHCLDMVQSRDFSETSEDSILDLIARVFCENCWKSPLAQQASQPPGVL